MKILRHLQVPTGDILIVNGSKGKLELLSLGDYGKDHNVVCGAMGLTRALKKVEHTTMLPLTEKWVVTISTQYGCSMNCKFCDVPKVGPGVNATANDMFNQVDAAMRLHPEIKSTERLNIHFARMGEPTWNPGVLVAAQWLRSCLTEGGYNVHPVVSTMMPLHNRGLASFIKTWMEIKNVVFSGNAGLQLSINSTSEHERNHMFSGNAMSLADLGKMMSSFIPIGRKITLNFALANYEIDAKKLARLFRPDRFLVKLTPMHKTTSCVSTGIATPGDYTSITPYQSAQRELEAEGFDVLVFIASEYEDLGRITCGNAVLSGSLPEVPYKEVAPSTSDVSN